MVYKGRLVVKLPQEWVAIGPRASGRWLRLAEEAKEFVSKGTGSVSRREKAAARLGY